MAFILGLTKAKCSSEVKRLIEQARTWDDIRW
jgi:hypothetical protein